MNVQRYECGMTNAPTEWQSPTMYQDANGGYVSYEAYAALEARCAALAAENAGLKAVCEDRRTFIMNGVQLGYIQVPTVETDPALETIRVAVSPQEPTPATDAFLAEVRAQGVDVVRNVMIDFVEGDVGPNENVPGLIRSAEICVSIAAQLRKGGA